MRMLLTTQSSCMYAELSGELWAYALLPLLFLGVFLYADVNRRKHGVWFGAFGLAGIILSHTITGYVTVVFYLIALSLYSLLLLLRKNSMYHLLFIIYHYYLWVLVCLPFWLPAITEMGYTNVAGQIGVTANFRDHFVCIGQLWNSLWGYGGSALGCLDGMSYKIGKIHVLLGALGVGLAGFRLRRAFWSHLTGLISMIGLGSALMLLSVSRPVWEIIPGLAFVQYPWRFLMGLAFAISVLGGSILFGYPDVDAHRVRGGCMIGVIVVNAKVFVPQFTYDSPVDFFESDKELSWRVSRISDEYLPQSFVKPGDSSQIAHEILSSQPLLGTGSKQRLIQKRTLSSPYTRKIRLKSF